MRYNSSLRPGRGLRNVSGKSTSLFTPFIILICVGLIGVLGFQLFSSLSEKEPDKGIEIELLSGSSELKAWGTEQFIDIPSGSFLMEGDEITTSSDSLMSLKFPEGSILRVGGGGDLIVEELNMEKEPYSVKLLLVNGEVWLNKMTSESGTTNFQVSLGNVVVKSNDISVLALENKMDEVVRVVSGASASVDVLNESKSKVVDTIMVGVGQEAYFSKEVLQKYWNYESPSIIVASSDTFRDGDFYDFNMEADRGNVDVSTLESDVLVGTSEEDLLISTGEESMVSSTEENPTVTNVVEENEPEENLVSGTLSAPKLTGVSGVTKTDENGFYVVTNYLATLSGTVSGASEVYVNDYKLQKFVSGGDTWTYFANAKYNLMKEGENVYNVYAKDANGKKSDVLTVKVFYKPAPVVSAPAVSSTGSSEKPVVTTTTETPTTQATEEVSSEMPDWL
ncbi:MAG: hypothetical protein RBS56_03075 [Candidatus Gracilibacteria bacterium]|jgi:hypothetical protein|nr:hypothetical protein [Candidatus Gracilibacteria bacterium]